MVVVMEHEFYLTTLKFCEGLTCISLNLIMFIFIIIILQYLQKLYWV